MEGRGAGIDATTSGDPARFLDEAQLEHAVMRRVPPPRDVGRLLGIVRRGEGGRREVLDQVTLDPEEGLPGDAWGRGARKPDGQLAVMEEEVAALVANGQPLALFGDNLFVELDLSEANLPAGSRLAVGEATVVVTPKPHNGCRKFMDRFGNPALKFVNMPRLRHLNLRGVYWRVEVGGSVRVGDGIRVLERAAPRVDVSSEAGPAPAREGT